MKITLDNNDAGKVLATFCPKIARYEKGAYRLQIKGKPLVLGQTDLSLRSRVQYQNISGDLSLKLNGSGVAITLDLQ